MSSSAGGYQLRDLRPRALQRAIGCCGRHAEQVSYLRRVPAEYVPQDQHGALPRRQVLKRRDEREPQTGAGRHDRGRIVGAGSHQRSRERLQPRHVQIRNRNGAVGVPGRLAQPGRQRPPGPGFERAQAGVRGDPVQPGAHRRPPFEVAVSSPRAQQRLLDLVLGVVHGAEHPVAVRQQLAAVWVGEQREVLAG